MNESYVQSTLLGWIIPLAICISVLLRRNKDLRQKLFVLFAGNVTLYYFFSFLHGFAFIQGLPGETWFERIALGVAVLIPQGGLRFFRAFSTGAKGMGRLGGMAAFLGIVLIVAIFYPSSLRPAIGPAVLVYVGGFMLVAILNLNVQAKNATTRVDAARIRYLVIGGFVTLSFLVVDRMDQVFDLKIPPFGLVMTIIYLYVISQAITRYRMLDLYEMIGRFAVLSLMGIALAGIYTGLIVWVGAGDSVRAFLASLVILILFDPLRELVERKITDFFLRERRILEQDIVKIRRQLAHVIDVEVMTTVLLNGFENSRRISHASLYFVDAHGRGFDLKGSVGSSPEMTRIEAADAKRHILSSSTGGATRTTSLTQQKERLLQGGQQDKAQAIGESIELLKEMRADALLTVEGDEHLFGFISISDERLNDPYSPEDLNSLKGLAGQVASTFENSLFYQQTKERDRLAALGQMAAGLAHEIRNPLGSLKGAAQVIEDMGDSTHGGTSDKELLGVIVEEVDRLNRVVSDFLTYARPSTGQPRIIDVNSIIKRTLQLFKTGHEFEMDVTTDLAETLPGCKIDGEQLHQVFLNLILNAYQAMEDQTYRRIEVTTRERIVRSLRDTSGVTQKPAKFAEIRFTDNGPGIEPKILENIFIPFFTTKQKGSGLGLAVCQRIIRDAGGEIEVRSQTGQGSIFTVVLPSLDEVQTAQ